MENAKCLKFVAGTLALQFGHGGEAVENRDARGVNLEIDLGFNSATAVKPWRTATSANGDWVEENGFNSATAVKPWRTVRLTGSVDRMADASIRPRR